VVIRQGDIYWVELDDPAGSEPGYLRPCVVVQNDVANDSRLNTVIVCALTSNLKRATAMGNVLLNASEGNLSKQSVVNVSQLYTFDKRQLGERIGMLSPARIRQVIAGIELLIEPLKIPARSIEQN